MKKETMICPKCKRIMEKVGCYYECNCGLYEVMPDGSLRNIAKRKEEGVSMEHLIKHRFL